MAQSALEGALGYALERVQFGEPIANFPRVADKIAMIAVEIMIARQLTYYAARQKDAGGADLKPACLTCLLCSLPQPNPGAAAVFIDKLDASGFESAPNDVKRRATRLA